MITINYTERINLMFGLAFTTIKKTEMLNNICLLEDRTHLDISNILPAQTSLITILDN